MNCILEGLCDVAVVGAHLISLHSSPTYVSAHDNFHDIDYRTRYEWVTPGAYVRMANGATAGAYRNSLGKASVYVGWTWQTDDERFALTVGAVSGYRRDFTVILNREWGHEPRVEKRGQAPGLRAGAAQGQRCCRPPLHRKEVLNHEHRTQERALPYRERTPRSH
jgi:hypothetical protein